MNSREVCEEEEEESDFNRLPDEVIITIFNKLRHLKSLGVCSIVCRRFCALTHLVRSVLLSVPPGIIWNYSVDNAYVSEPPQSLRPIDLRSTVLSLAKFTELRSVELELPLRFSVDDDDDRFPVIKWKAEFGVVLETFLFVCATSVREINPFPESLDSKTSQGGGGGGGAEFISSDWRVCEFRLAFQCLKDALLWRTVLLYLIGVFPKLDSVAISDSKARGLISAGGERLAEARRTMKLQSTSFSGAKTVKQWCVPTLRLPLSGCVMEGATLFTMRIGDEDSTGGDDDCSDGVATRPGLFESGEEVFAEAVREMMVNHKSTMKKLW